MKLFTLTAGALLCVALCATAYSETSCDFNIVGTWEATRNDEGAAPAARYRFNANGTATTLRRAGSVEPALWKDLAGGNFLYNLDDPKTPTLIELLDGNGKTTRGTLTVTQFDRDSFTTSEGTLDTEAPSVRWLHVESQKYFIVFAARGGGDVHSGGPAFAMLVKTEGGLVQSDAFGLYLAENEPVIGQIPQKLRKQFMADSKLEGGTMLRVELSAAEFDRSTQVMRTWRKRADDQALLYDTVQLNNIVFLKQIAESVNRCGDVMELYQLTWKIDDKLATHTDLPGIALRYVEQLKQLNLARHVTDQNFLNRTGVRCGGACT